MDFNQRNNRVPQPVAVSHPATTPHSRVRNNGNLRYAFVVLLFSIAILLAALIFSIARTNDLPGDGQFVDLKLHQAVFLNGGQVYFGKIKQLAKKSMVMDDIYYLKVNQQVQPGQQAGANDVTLVKLGCELHGPADRMVINREQVVFWENLKDKGQVAGAIKKYKDQNPGEQKCESSTQTDSGAKTAPATTTTPAPASNRRP